jgi:hypothetical protein
MWASVGTKNCSQDGASSHLEIQSFVGALVVISKTEGIYSFLNGNSRSFGPLSFLYFGLQSAYILFSKSTKASQSSAAESCSRSTPERTT